MSPKLDLEKQLQRSEANYARLKTEFKDFIYSIAHDLSGPMRQASGFSEMILRNNADTLDDKTKKHLNIILSSALKGRESLEALRNYSSILENNVIFEENIAVQDCIDTALSNLQSETLYTDNIQIGDKALPHVKCDSAALTQLFYQLLKNSTLFQPDGQMVSISIGCNEREGLQGTSEWVFHVLDNGIGIIPHRIDDVFKPFKRCHSKDEYPGEGLGLTVAKNIVTSHFGTIWIDKEVTQGTKIYFTLPKDNI